MFRRRLVAFAILAVILTLPSVASAQLVVGYREYFSNANTSLPDGTLRILNPPVIPVNVAAGPGDVCAMIYVFKPDQQLEECCGCRITPNGLLKFSINNNLTSNPLHGGTLTDGSLVIIPSNPNVAGPAGSSATCNPGGPIVQPAASADLALGATHVQDSGAITETWNAHFFGWLNTFGPALAARCNLEVIQGGSGQGLCNCLGTGDPDPTLIALDPPAILPSTPIVSSTLSLPGTL